MSAALNELPDTAPPPSPDQPPPGQPPPSGRARPSDRRRVEVLIGIGLVVLWAVSSLLLEPGWVGAVLLGALLPTAFHSLVQRRPWRALLLRDTASFARGRAGKLLVAVVLVAVPVAMILVSAGGGRFGRYADDSWKALLMLAVLAGSYAASRRLLLTVLIGAVTVAVVSWVLSPDLAVARTGDHTVLAHIDQQAGKGWLASNHAVAVAEIDLGAAQPVRLAGIGADDTTPMEVGSMTKAMTGLVIADAVHRGEVRMDAPVATYLPQLQGTPAGTATLQELVTHTSGYAEFGAATVRRAAWMAPLGKNFFTADSAQLTNETRNQTLQGRGRYAYSTLGSAIAGQAVAAAAHLSYPDLMRTRLFEAPGMAALEPTTATDQSNKRIGSFWNTSTWQTGQTITHHAGQTSGYASYLGLDRPRNKAVIVLSDIANNGADLGTQLLADRS